MTDHDAIATTFLATFAGNLGPDPTDVRPPDFATHDGTGWRRARRAPTTADVAAAFMGGPALSLYFLAEDGRGHVTALDCDGELGEANARKLAAHALALGLPCILDASPSGAHLWWSLDRRLPAVALRRGLLAIAQAVGLEGDPKVELRPVGDHGLGACLRAPGTVSPKSGRRSVLVDPATGDPLPERLGALLAVIEQASASRWLEVGETYRPPAPPPASHTIDRAGEAFVAEVPVSLVLAREWGLDRAGPGRSVRCPLHDDRNASLSIARDDRRAWCHSPACELHRDGRGVSAWDLARLAGVPA